MRKTITFFFLLISLVACTQWPKQSTGGYASYYIFTPNYQKELEKTPCLLFLSHRLALLIEKTLPYYNSHVAKCFPARIVLLRGLQRQIAQEIANGLVVAANVDLMLYEDNLSNLAKLNKARGCPRPALNRSWEHLKMRIQ